MKRREALNKLVLGTGTAVLLPASILTSCSEDPAEVDPGNNNSNSGGGNGLPLEINLDDPAYSSLAAEGGFTIVSGIIVANAGGGNFIALSSVCTHAGCSVSYDGSANNFPCFCHGSVFSAGGSVLQGPASRPLQQYTVSRMDNILMVS